MKNLPSILLAGVLFTATALQAQSTTPAPIGDEKTTGAAKPVSPGANDSTTEVVPSTPTDPAKSNSTGNSGAATAPASPSPSPSATPK